MVQPLFVFIGALLSYNSYIVITLFEKELFRAQGRDHRIAVFSTACETFDHADEGLHNIELTQGTAQALAKQLSMTTNDDEVRKICSALEMVFRGSPKSVQLAYEKCGSVFPMILLRILTRCETGTCER